MLIGDCVDSTGQGSPGVETVQDSIVPSGRSPLHQTRLALLARVGTVQEARVHAALMLAPDAQGLDVIERLSGLDRKTLLGHPGRGTAGVIPVEGTSSALLVCEERGVFSVEPEERQPMVVRPLVVAPANSSPVHQQDFLKTYLSSKKKGGPGGVDLEDGGQDRLDGGQMTSLAQARWIDRYESLLSPNLDLWANRPVGNREALGDAGWALALVYGPEPVTVSLADVQGLLGKSAQQTQRIVDRLGFTRTKGRRAEVIVDFSEYISEQAEEEGWYDSALRAVLKSIAAEQKRQAVGRRSTRHGYAAYRIVQYRETVARYVPDPDWQALVLTASEEDLGQKLATVVEQEGELPRWARDLLAACREHRNRGELVRPLVEALAEAEPEEREGLRELINRRFDADIPQRLSWLADGDPVDLDPVRVVQEAAAREQERQDEQRAETMALIRARMQQREAARELAAA